MTWEKLLIWLLRAGGQALAIRILRQLVTELQQYTKETDTDIDDRLMAMVLDAVRVEECEAAPCPKNRSSEPSTK